uniref:C2H2-type domain-containing protein n=1 Tax=Neolamprologus brichardi TaxID=32507 RepID=A0A3Q4HVG2_NEOBR
SMAPPGSRWRHAAGRSRCILASVGEDVNRRTPSLERKHDQAGAPQRVSERQAHGGGRRHFSAHILQIKNVKSLKASSSRPHHPSQSIQRWHSCNECGKGFNFACQLEVHMRWHTKEKPYSCAVCRKSFTTVSMLKRHHRIHTGEKPFRCHVCGKCFNQSAHLNTHFRLHTRERAGWSRAPHCEGAAALKRKAKLPEGIVIAPPSSEPEHPEVAQLQRVREGLQLCLPAGGPHALAHQREAIQLRGVPEELHHRKHAEEAPPHPHRREALPLPRLREMLQPVGSS